MSGEPWFLVDPLPPVGPFRLTGPEGRHAATVRRLRAGEILVLTDGLGGTAVGTVSSVDRSELSVQVSAVTRVPAPTLRVVLVQALAKGERSDLAVGLATEAGVDAIVPWQAARCVARWTGDKADRGVRKWRQVAQEAAKQARRPFVPEIATLADSRAVAELIRTSAAALALHEAESTPLLSVDLPSSGDLVLIVGPEGGIADEELALFGTAGAVPVRLGPEVLRTSTAGAVALGALGVLTGRWAGSPPGGPVP